MKTLTNSTTSIRLEFPRFWDPSTISAVSIHIADTENNELLESTDAELYTASALDADTRRYSRSLVLAEDSEDLAPGDMIRIVGVNGYEDHTVKGWDATGLTATLEDFVDRDFEEGASVYRLSAIATVDLSDTDTFPPGVQVVITWTPTGTGAPFTEMAEIETALQIDVAAFTQDFQALYPRAYNALTTPKDRFDIVIRLAQDELRGDLKDRLLDVARVKDQRLLSPPLMALVAYKWALGGDDGTSDEREGLAKAYSAAFEKLCRLPIWEDSDGDGVQDDGEVEAHPVVFERTW